MHYRTRSSIVPGLISSMKTAIYLISCAVGNEMMTLQSNFGSGSDPAGCVADASCACIADI